MNLNEQQKLTLHLHLAQCEECRTTAYVWYLKRHGIAPLPPGRRDSWLVKLRHRMGWDRIR